MSDADLQPLDSLMTRLGLSNADLVKASTEQLSFKNVQKGRKGRRLSPKLQDKILRALVAARPELKIRRRDLFRYDLDEDAVRCIDEARLHVSAGKIKYSQFIDRLLEAGINRYAVEVASHRTTYYGGAGEAYVIQGPIVSEAGPGRFGETALRSAIADAQKAVIDYPTFLKRIYNAGIVSYEVNIRDRKIVYRGEAQSYKEFIPASTAAPVVEPPKPEPVAPEAAKKPVKAAAKPKKSKKSVKVKNSLKARKAKRAIKYHRVKKKKTKKKK